MTIITNKWERILLIILALVVLIIVGVSIPALAKKRAVRDEAVSVSEESSEKIWTQIGRIRLPLENQPAASSAGRLPAATLVISVSFPYDNSDRAWVEELALNNTKFAEDIINYFSLPHIRIGNEVIEDAMPKNGIFNEERIKTHLLTLFNSHLHLNKIKTLYFSEFMILE
ncbi:MAG: hypothetical protein Ta2G_10900 [Termitinemataceae bacterium]|nr:MAG: hypothetical protein Ta2G_10900 [Termitinemataceae bacterium]